ncbi:DNA primase [Paracoccus sp. MC1862]|uniref:DNA primase n=1 Tax=Paracoccus sp. MC1862 TaxID=2760307 RepID=UPI001604837A|nr:DNA primase [Paracoccus sp. MC1862]MBB1496604.1 DNA primase [Paracoccus sp. MC1862]QQO43623.1 DNA primase [Paracoccus sp. MC1862]
MSLPPGFLDELRNRVPISRIVGRKVTWDLKRSNQAKGDWWAPCPFHGEKTASFHVDDQKGFYYCFGCHAKGDALSFLREAEGLGFIEAVAVMASEAGLPMPERSPREQAQTDRRTQLVEVMDRAIRWFRLQLQSGAGGAARDYLGRRGLEAAALDRFEIGFAPDLRQGLLRHLTEAGVPEGLVIEAGLAARPDADAGRAGRDGGAAYDRFRGRIIFPIRDARGRCISFGGRAMDPNARAKYLNGPETALFDKGRNLYNLGPARAAVAKGQPLVVAEGYMDVIALVRAGVEGAVAPLGTAITEDQLRLMWRVSPEPVIALDGDVAGLRAAMRLIDMALPLAGPGQALRFALLPAGQDPDDLIRAGGAGAIRAVLDQAQPLVDLLWRRETEGRVFDSPERRAALDKALTDAVAHIPDPGTRDHYTQELKRKRWALFAPPRAERGRFTRREGRRDPPQPPVPQTRASSLVAADPGEALIEAMILALLATHPSLIARVESRLERLDPTDPGRAALVHDLLAGASSLQGRTALDAIMADPHVRSAPAIIRPTGAIEDAERLLLNDLDRLEARRARREENLRAEREIEGLADEGLTWRVTQSARALREADQPQISGNNDLGEDREALIARLNSVREENGRKRS